MLYYKVYNLIIKSEMEIPEFNSVSAEPVDKPDIFIHFGEVRERLPYPTKLGVCYTLGNNVLHLKIPGIARYLAWKGNEIIIDPAEEAATDAVRSFIFDAPISCIMHQRNMLPVYGAAIKNGDQAFMVIGISGNGKSTAAFELIKRGYKLISDDISVISDFDGKLTALPAYPSIKLPLDTIKRADMNPDDFPTIRDGIVQKRIPVDTTDFCDQHLPIEKIYILSGWNKSGTEIKQLEENTAKFNLLHDSMHRQYLAGMGGGFSLVKITAKLMSTMPAAQIVHSRNVKDIDKMIDMIEEDLKNE